MKIIITGHAGFIGYHLVKRIIDKEKYQVIGIDNFNNYYDQNLKNNRFRLIESQLYKHYNCNISNQEKLFEIIDYEKPELIIHLAAQAGVRFSLESPQTYFESNFKGFFNILESCRVFKIKNLIFASSFCLWK